MSELDTSHYLENRDIEYTEIAFEEVALEMYGEDGRIATNSMFSGTVRVDEDFNVDWIDIGVKLHGHDHVLSLNRKLYDGLVEGVKEAVKIQFGEWLATLPVDDEYEHERDRAYYHAQVL